MIHDIYPDVVRLIREYGELSPEAVATSIGRKRQVVSRWEGKNQQLLPKRSQEKILVELAKLTLPAFGDIMCKVLTKFVGRRFTMEPAGPYSSSLPLSRALDDYRLNRDHLNLEEQQAIEEMLEEGRILDAGVARACGTFEKNISRIIKQARARKRSGPANDGNDGSGSDDDGPLSAQA